MIKKSSHPYAILTALLVAVMTVALPAADLPALGSTVGLYGAHYTPESMAVYRGNLVLAGDFSLPLPRTGVAVLRSAVPYRLTEAPDGTVASVAVLGDDLYVAGRFDRVGSATAANIARWDGTGWSDVGGGPGGPVAKAAVGGFGVAVALESGPVMWWNGTAWIDTLAPRVNATTHKVTHLVVSGRQIGIIANKAASRWSNGVWTDMTEAEDIPNRVTADHAMCLTVDGDDVIVGAVLQHFWTYFWHGSFSYYSSYIPIVDRVSPTGTTTRIWTHKDTSVVYGNRGYYDSYFISLAWHNGSLYGCTTARYPYESIGAYFYCFDPAGLTLISSQHRLPTLLSDGTNLIAPWYSDRARMVLPKFWNGTAWEEDARTAPAILTWPSITGSIQETWPATFAYPLVHPDGLPVTISVSGPATWAAGSLTVSGPGVATITVSENGDLTRMPLLDTRSLVFVTGGPAARLEQRVQVETGREDYKKISEAEARLAGGVRAYLSGGYLYSYSATSDSARIAALYRILIEREPDATELATHLAHLSAGYRMDEVLADIVHSPEHLALSTQRGLLADTAAGTLWMGRRSWIGAWYRHALGREANGNELTSWESGFAAKRSGHWLAAAALLGGEGSARLTDTKAFIQAFFRAGLGREPDAGEMAAWSAQIDGGTSRERALVALVRAGPFASSCAALGLAAEEIPGIPWSPRIHVRVGVEVNYQVVATNYPTAFTVNALSTNGVLPPGLVMDVTGLITGTPTTQGTYWISVDATNPAGTRTGSPLECTVAPELGRLTSSRTIRTVVGVPVAHQLTGAAVSTWSMSGLPDGLVFNAASGWITGTPTQAVEATAMVLMTNSGAEPSTATMNIQVSPAPVAESASAAANDSGSGKCGLGGSATVLLFLGWLVRLRRQA